MTFAIALDSFPATARHPRVENFVSALQAGRCAQLVVEGFLRYDAGLREIVRRAPERFATGDWQGAQLDEAERVELHAACLRRTAEAVRGVAGGRLQDAPFWEEVRRHVAMLVEGSADGVLCQSFLRACGLELGCRLPESLLLRGLSWQRAHRIDGMSAGLRNFEVAGTLEQRLAAILRTVPLESEWADVDASATCVGGALKSRGFGAGVRLEMLEALFHRFSRAYVIGSLTGPDGREPFAIELGNRDDGVVVLSVLCGESELGRLVRPGEAVYHVDVESPMEAALYLQSLLPRSKAVELLPLLGYPQPLHRVPAG